jgi:hypothetical protein
VKILTRLPYFTDATVAPVREESVRVKPYQIVVQMSLNLRTFVKWDPRTPSFPAVLDTGNNHNLSIRSEQLVRWAGIQPQALKQIGAMRERGQRVPLHAAAAWLHGNVPEKRVSSDREPHLLNLREGIAIYPDDVGPRLPVLGLRALTQNGLHLIIDPERLRVDLRTRGLATTLLRALGRFL